MTERLSAETRDTLLRVPVHQRIYSRIRSRAEFRQKIDLLNMFGESVRETFVMNDAVQAGLQLPFMFTREGYDAIDFSINVKRASATTAKHTNVDSGSLNHFFGFDGACGGFNRKLLADIVTHQVH